MGVFRVALRRLATATLLAITALLPIREAWAESTGSLADVFASGAVAYAEVAGAAPVVDRLHRSALLRHVYELPQFEQARSGPQFQKVQALRTIVERQLGTDLWTLGKQVLGDRFAVAAYPAADADRPRFLAVVRAAGPEVVARLRRQIEPFLVLAGERLERSETISGAEVLSFDGELLLAVRDRWIIVGNDRELVRGALGRLFDDEQTEKTSLADDKPFQQMTADLGKDHLARVYVNTDLLSRTAGDRFGLPQKLDNPLGSLLVGGILELAASSPYAGLTVDLGDRELTVTAGLAGEAHQLDEAHRVFFAGPDQPGAAPIPEVQGLVGGISIYRDFSGWYRNREQLLQAQVLPGFDKFETGLSNLLPGRDFTTDVLPPLGSRITFVSAPQDYGHLDGEPGVKLPAFGLILELEQPQQAADTLRLFFQTLTSILNIQAGQQGRQPWVMTSETYQGVQISYGRYLEQPKGERLPLVFNFLPASALVEDRFVLTSSLGLCRQLIDAIQSRQGDSSAEEHRNFDLQFRAGPFAELLESNRDPLQARSIQQGRTIEQARAEFNSLLKLIRAFESFRLSTHVRPKTFQTRLQIRWQ